MFFIVLLTVVGSYLGLPLTKKMGYKAKNIYTGEERVNRPPLTIDSPPAVPHPQIHNNQQTHLWEMCLAVKCVVQAYICGLIKWFISVCA